MRTRRLTRWGQTIRVVDTSFFGKVLLLDEDVMLTERDEAHYHEMLVHVPLAYLPNVRAHGRWPRSASPHPLRPTGI